MEIVRDLPLVDDTLGKFRLTIGRDFEAYRNHVYRVVNLCYSASDLSESEKDKIQIAACFHDIGIWTASTLDYLSPSEKVAIDYLHAEGKQAWVAEITEMIEMHHRIRSCASSASRLVELFRRADTQIGIPQSRLSLATRPVGISLAVAASAQSAAHVPSVAGIPSLPESHFL
jgi:hypothetical protein